MPKSLHLMAKPAGPNCNLKCEYCFYLEKNSFFKGSNKRMSDKVLEAYIIKTAECNKDLPEVSFAWQGGEPSLVGLDFFRKAVALQKKYIKNKKVVNSFQTNGTLINDEWCSFFHDNKFLVGLSLDGPEKIHDKYRKDPSGNGSFDKVNQALEIMQKYKVEYNILCCVNNISSKHPLEIYRFFKNRGIQFIQFIPIVERIPATEDIEAGLLLSSPDKVNVELTDWSVKPKEYGKFLSEIFDEWIRNDVGKVFVMNFEWGLCGAMGIEPPVCQHRKICGDALILENNGDIYSCDHFMYPGYHLGNIQRDSLEKIANSKKQNSFGKSKLTKLPFSCRQCKFINLCNGGCIKHRFIDEAGSQHKSNYLCEGYKKFFTHSQPYMALLAKLINKGYPPEKVMEFSRRNFIPKIF